MRRWALAGTASVTLLPVLVFGAGIGAVEGASAGSGQAQPSQTALQHIPPAYLQLYIAAGAAYGVPWPVLAGIGEVECDHGQNPDPSCSKEGAVNYAGAGGPMQFLASTWTTYGVDANRDGTADRWDPPDAIYAAARYLRANGAPGNLPAAIYAYNHSWAYVHEVLRWASIYQAALPTSGRYVFPIPAGVPWTSGRVDMGWDIETGPASVGKPLVAIGDALILHVQPMENGPGDPGFGPTWISYRLLDGPDAGRTIYIGHSGPPLTAAGQKVRAGQPIILIHGGSYGGPAGHLETGWANQDGTNTLAATHYTEGQITAEGLSFKQFAQTLQSVAPASSGGAGG